MFIIYLWIVSSLSETLKYLFNKFRSNHNIPNTNIRLHEGINESHIVRKTLSKRMTESEIFRRVKRDRDITKEKGEFIIDFFQILKFISIIYHLHRSQ